VLQAVWGKEGAPGAPLRRVRGRRSGDVAFDPTSASDSTSASPPRRRLEPDFDDAELPALGALRLPGQKGGADEATENVTPARRRRLGPIDDLAAGTPAKEDPSRRRLDGANVPESEAKGHWTP